MNSAIKSVDFTSLDRLYESLCEKEFDDWELTENERKRIAERAGLLTDVTNVMQAGKGRKGLTELAKSMQGKGFATALVSNFADGFGRMDDMPSGPKKKRSISISASKDSSTGASSTGASMGSSTDTSLCSDLSDSVKKKRKTVSKDGDQVAFMMRMQQDFNRADQEKENNHNSVVLDAIEKSSLASVNAINEGNRIMMEFKDVMILFSHNMRKN